jgi:Protein of unknown function (DUF3662)/FHA domain
MGLQRFEKRIERAVEGAFARAFRSQVRPVELGRRLAREMDLAVNVGVRGERVAPNAFAVHLAPEDVERLADDASQLAVELADAAQEHADDEGYVLKGPAEVELVEDPDQRPGQFDVRAFVRLGPIPTRPSAWLVDLTGARVAVTDGDPISIGRLPECDITVDDVNVSRRHCEIRVVEGKARVVDLGSLNGTRLNGRGVPPNGNGAPLANNDEVWVGAARLRFVIDTGAGR